MTSFHTVIILGIAILLMGLESAANEKKENKLPDKAKSILDKADQFDLLSLDPDRSQKHAKDAFHGWKVLGRTVVKEARIRREIMGALYKGILESDGIGSKCFDPRHGIRATAAGKTVDLVICFECSWIYVYYDSDENLQSAVTTSTPQPTFDKVLKDAGVPLPKPATK